MREGHDDWRWCLHDSGDVGMSGGVCDAVVAGERMSGRGGEVWRRRPVNDTYYERRCNSGGCGVCDAMVAECPAMTTSELC